MHVVVEGTSRALREDASGDLASLRSQLIILIKSSFLLHKLTNMTKQDFNSMLYKIVSAKEISYAYICKKDIAFRCSIVNITYYHAVNET